MSQRDRVISDFAALLRPKTPHGADLTDREVISRWEPGRLIFSAEKYGDQTCTCGHPIKHVFEVRLTENHSVTAAPVGSTCVCEVFGESDAVKSAVDLEKALRKIYALLRSQWCEHQSLSLDESVVTSANGFTLEAMEWLKTRIEPRKWSYLCDLRRRKSVHRQSNRQAWFLHYTALEIAKTIEAASGEGFEL